MLFYVFYGLPKLGNFLSSMQAAILGLTIATSAYMSETFRSGLLAIRRDQFDAARSLGLPFGHIIGGGSSRRRRPPSFCHRTRRMSSCC